MISNVLFGAVNLTQLKPGRTHVVQNNQTGAVHTFASWKLDASTQPPTATLLDAQGKAVASVPVRREGGCCPKSNCCEANYIADTLDLSTKK